MTDDIKAQVAETVARLRAMPTYSGDPKGPHWVPNLAADLLEAIAARLAEVEVERDDLQALNRENMRQWAAAIDRAEAAEAEIARLKTPEGAAGVLLDWWENVDQDDPTLEAAIDVALIMGDTQEEVDRWHNALRSLSQGGPK